MAQEQKNGDAHFTEAAEKVEKFSSFPGKITAKQVTAENGQKVTVFEEALKP